ncbi:MAG: carboxypeptidase regulatory-like domain-containing protein [Deltaproteobacteria bacterium]|nr:carboxypeptidase regulatory-like domain-containing protein [Deltaproteobacteria bacterium]
MRIFARAPYAAVLGLFCACDSSEEAEHASVPEADLPLTQSLEVGPAGEGLFEQPAIAGFERTEGKLDSGEIQLESGASRVSVWVRAESGAPQLWVQAGWSNGQTGPWVQLGEVWSEGKHRVLAAGLDTVATRVRFRIDETSAPSIQRLWWTANIPLDPSLRASELAESEAPLPEGTHPRSEWLARKSVCGSDVSNPSRVRLTRIPAPFAGDATDVYLRALQAMGVLGQQGCDLGPTYLVGEPGLYEGRGDRASPRDSPSDAQGRFDVAILGCTSSDGLERAVAAGLTAIAERHPGLGPDEISIRASRLCATSEWLDDTLSRWPPEQPPPPPMTEVVNGFVWDQSTGSEANGSPLSGVDVTCSCGALTTSGPTGAWSLSLPTGTHTITLSKAGFTPVSLPVVLDGVDTTRVTAGMDPTVAPPTQGSLDGFVFDRSTGDATTGAAVPAASVLCSCGPQTTSDANGRFGLTLPLGTHTLTVSKADYQTSVTSVSVVAGTQNVSLGIDPSEPMSPGVSVIDHSFLIQRFGGVDADPTPFPETEEGFQQYLDAVGVTYFAAWEYVEPHNPAAAADCGYTLLLPDRSMWRKAAALGLLADQLRSLVGEPVTLRNWWRPPCYNEAVGGEPGGDHPDADALDLDFRSNSSRAAAQRYLCENYWSQDLLAPDEIAPGSNLNPRLNLSVGLGGVTIHLGLLSRNGRRFWKYASYTDEANSGNCW